MKILHGRRITIFGEAAKLAFQDAGVDDMSPAAAELFQSVITGDDFRSKGEKLIDVTIRKRYGVPPNWNSVWYIAVPEPGYDTRSTPHITVDLKMCLVATAEVRTGDRDFPVTLLEPFGKPENLVIPLIFIQAIFNDDIARFPVIAKSGGRTVREIPGFKPIELPDDFVIRLSNTLGRKSVAAWLMDFGFRGRNITPLVVGTLLGLQFGNAERLTEARRETTTTAQLVSDLEGMAYSIKEAKDMVSRAAPYLKANDTEEEALRIVLQQAGKRG
jgi:hypothetical protein